MARRQRVGNINVLVTGGLGYVGSVLLPLLIRTENIHVLCIDNMNSPHSRNVLCPLMGLDLFEDFTFVNWDVRDEAKMEETIAMYKPDAVVNLAAIVGEPLCKQYPHEAYTTNLEAAVKLANLARKYDARFIAFSTCSNYGLRPDDDIPANEQAPLTPVSLYAESKVKMEELLAAKDHVTILRLATVFGLSPAMRWDLLLNQFVAEAHKDARITVYGPEAWRPVIYVGDVARIVLSYLEHPVSGVFNVGSNEMNYTKGELAKMVAQEFNVPIETTSLDDKRSYRVDFTKLEESRHELFTEPRGEIHRMKHLFDSGYRL